MEIPQELSSCVNKALYRLSLSDLTERELMDYLTDPRRKNTGFSEGIARRTVDFLKEKGMVDDLRFLKETLRRLDAKGFGKRRIREELQKKKFSPRYVEAAMNRKTDEARRAGAVLERIGSASLLAATPAGRKKLVDKLVRLGYDYTTARVAVATISEEDDLFSE